MLIQLETQCSKPKPRSVFYSYSHKDEDLRDELDVHLKLLKRDGFISTWHDRMIRPGDEWDHVINENLNTADLILFLVSHHFLASQYCRDIEVKRAMERYHKREAILIPIILKPCVWTSEEFAKLQVLPKNCRPLAEWPDSGFAQVAEELRTMLVDMLYPQKPSEATGGQHGNWILKLRSRPDVDTKERGRQLVKRLREYTEDFSINLQATATTQIMDGEKAQVGLMLILTGTPDAFAILDKAQRDGQLATAIDEDILSLYVINGATVKGSSNIGGVADSSINEDSVHIVRVGRQYTPPLIKGVSLPKGECGELTFIFDSGNADSGDAIIADSVKILPDYFRTGLVVGDSDLWVNLSAYESDRMLPSELSGTRLGRDMLASDCMLKRVTASLMHPDSNVGREYWDAVYTYARRKWGTSKMPFLSFQKVWVLPKVAEVFEYDGDTYHGESLPMLDIQPNRIGAYVTDFSLDVKCEADLVARKHTEGNVNEIDQDFTLDLFRQIVLPALFKEVNEGEHLALLRQIYCTLILVRWAKDSIHLTHCGRLKEVLAGRKEALDINAPRIRGESDFDAQLKRQVASQHLIPDSPAFEIPENVEFFSQYMQLFKNGVFRCARNEGGDLPDERIIRVYFSGAVDFQNLKEVIRILDAVGISST